MTALEPLWLDTYKMQAFTFEGRQAIHVFPSKENATNRWIYKTEYFGAFPELELELVKRGCHLIYLQNKCRWGLSEDTDAKIRFAKSLITEYELSPRCVLIGMSAGGACAMLMAANYPEMVGAIYLDAPVVNYLSCPFGMGVGTSLPPSAKDEILSAFQMTVSDVIAYRNHPLDHIPDLIHHRIPIALVAGGEDMAVPYIENGKYIEEAYIASNIPFYFEFSPKREHHPHGPSNIEATIDFLLECAWPSTKI